MSGNQRFICGMRRFDKHRMDSSMDSVSSPVFQKEIQDRLKAREQEDRLLYSYSSVSSSISSSVSFNTSDSSVTTYTPWRTPAAPSR